MGRFTGFAGLIVIMGIAWLCSSHKRAIKLKLIAWGLGLQFAFAILVLKTNFGKLFQAIGAARDNAFEDGELSPKHKLLIALAIDVALRAVRELGKLHGTERCSEALVKHADSLEAHWQAPPAPPAPPAAPPPSPTSGGTP